MTTPVVPRIIWMYWENRPGYVKPSYLELCAETISRNRGQYELRLLDERTVEDYITLPAKVRRLEEIAHRADYIRFHLLARYGGVWLDADVVLLRDIGDAIEPYIGDMDFLGYGREPGKPSINFMASGPGCDLMVAQCKAIENVLAGKRAGLFSRKIRLLWTEIGHDTLWDLAGNYPYYHHSLERIAPIFWKDWELFLDSSTPLSRVLDTKPFMVMLYNDFMGQRLRGKSREEVLNDGTLLSRVFHHALENVSGVPPV